MNQTDLKLTTHLHLLQLMICAIIHVTGRWHCKPNILNVQQLIVSLQ